MGYRIIKKLGKIFKQTRIIIIIKIKKDIFIIQDYDIFEWSRYNGVGISK